MARILIAYCTHEGQTKSVAVAMAEALEAAGHQVRVADVREPEPGLWTEGFDAVLLGGSVHLGAFDKRLKGWVPRHRGELANTPSGFFAVCLAATGGEPQQTDAMGYAERFFEASAWRPNLVTFVPGALMYRRYNLLTRWVMKRVARTMGLDTDTGQDWVYTDYDAARAWAVDAGAALLGQDTQPALFCLRKPAA